MPRLLLISAASFVIALTPSVVAPANETVFAQPQPAKKTSHRSQPAARGHSAPDVTATIPQAAKPAAPAAPATDKDDNILPAPFNLPAASRARIRACGEAWQDLKMSGNTGSQTWRAYATQCLAGKAAPETKPR